MEEKIVVVGSNSFSGSHFVDYALSEGMVVVGISRSKEAHSVFLPYKNHENPSFCFYQLDLNNDLKQIMETIRSFQPAYVVNFAAQSMVAESWQNPEQWFQTNVVANVKLHEQLRTCGFLKRYVHVSTPEVYGTCEGIIQENTSYNPSTPYAVSRTAADLSLMNLYKTFNFPVVFTRAANVFGPGQQLYRIIPRAIFSFLTGQKLKLHGGGHSTRSFIYIRDVVDGTLRVARHASLGEIFHFSTSRNISIRSLVEIIASQMNVSLEEHVDVVGDRVGKDSAYLLDSTKAKEVLGWNDQVSLEQGIEETIAWIRDNLDVIKQQPLDYIHKP